MKIKALIIDDDAFYITLLKEYCLKMNIEVIATFTDSIEALNYLENYNNELIFLDIHMPNLNGFELIENTPNAKVIFSTQDETQAIKAFDHAAIDYLLKPVEFSRFVKAIKKVTITSKPHEDIVSETEKNENTLDHIYVNINKRLVKVDLNNIEYIQANGNYIVISLENNKDNLIVHSTLKKTAVNLPSHLFTQIHRSYIINNAKVVDIEDSSVVIGRKVIPIGKNYREDLMNNLKLLNN